MTTTRKGLRGLALAASVAAVVGTGCARQNVEQADAAKMGAQMQQAGVMSQGDYVRVRELGLNISRTHSLSTADLDWTLGLLGRAENSIARARALTVLSEIRPMSAAQKSKIAPAVAPYLNSADALDRLGAQRVERAMQSGD